MALSKEQLAALRGMVNKTKERFQEAYTEARSRGKGTVFCFQGYYYSAYTVTEYLGLTEAERQSLENRILQRMKEDGSTMTLLENWNETRKRWGDSPYEAKELSSLDEAYQEEMETGEWSEKEEEEVDAYEHMLSISLDTSE